MRPHLSHGLIALAATVLTPGLAQAGERLTEPAVTALVSAKNEAMLRRDWDTLRSEYLPTAQIVGLYYDRSKTPHVHNGPASTDVAATAALMTKRTGYAASPVVSRVFLSPDGQRGTVLSVLTVNYEAGGAHVHRVFDNTMILDLTAGQPRIAQDISVERPPE